jgi:hypothetical protein
MMNYLILLAIQRRLINFGEREFIQNYKCYICHCIVLSLLV